MNNRKKKENKVFVDPLREQPQSIDAEKAVLSALMQDTKSIAKAIESIDESYFYLESHRVIYMALVTLFDKKVAIDMLTLNEELDRQGKLDEIGGPYYLAEVNNAVPSAANMDYHLEIVKNKALSRRLIQVCNEVIEQAYEQEKNVDEMLDRAEREVFDLAQNRVKQGFDNLNDILHVTFEQIEELYHTAGTGVTGIDTGFKKLNELTAGFQKSEFIVVAGRPSMGKTAFALNLMRNAAVDHNIPVGFFSLEMSSEALALRLLCTESKVNQMAVRNGRMSSEELKRLSQFVGILSEAPIFIDDSPGLNVLQLRSKARRMVAEHKVQLFIVDYLQLMEEPNQDNRQQEITKISRALKALAKELNVPVVALSQLSRAVETRDKTKKPQLSDLRESGAIEQDADVVMFVYRPEYYKIETFEDTGQPTHNMCEIIIGKQRNGPVGTVRLTFLKEFGKFADPPSMIEESVYPTESY